MAICRHIGWRIRHHLDIALQFVIWDRCVQGFSYREKTIVFAAGSAK